MCECFKKKSFKEFSVWDAGRDFQCKECGRTMKIKDWTKMLIVFGCGITAGPLNLLFHWLREVLDWKEGWFFLFIISIALVVLYVGARLIGYWMYSISWRLDEKHRQTIA